VLATSAEVFLRRGFGERYFGLQAAAVLLAVPLYGLLWEGHDLSLLMLFLALYIAAWCTARIGITRRRIAGAIEHSQYGGWPVLLSARPFRGMSELTAKRLVEPLFVLASGVGVAQVDPPLGSYLMLAAGGMAVSVRLAFGYQRARLVDMRDAFIEQKNLMERFRRGN
jgi:hypothetical protein